MKSATVRTFVPESWGQVDIFRNFYQGTHTFTSDRKSALLGVTNHFEKAQTLRHLVIKLIPNLGIDQDELNKNGYTTASNARELCEVIETIFIELYSSIDCTRKIVSSIYHGTRRLPDSTRKLFTNTKAGLLGSDFPPKLNEAFAEAEWYEKLLFIRDALTHSNIGTCLLDKETQKITYSHDGVRSGGKGLEVSDVMAYIQTLFDLVSAFIGRVFHFLNSQLQPFSATLLCGIFYGRGYMRTLDFFLPISFDSGECKSHNWFDNEIELRCPFADSCGAYKTGKTNQQANF